MAAPPRDLRPLPSEAARSKAFFARLFKSGKVYTAPLELGVEYEIDGEQEAIREMTALLGQLVEQHIARGDSQRRAVHTKQTAYVCGRIEVQGDLKPELRVGLFATPGTYEIRVRYSNASQLPQSDRKRDVRGMAIKVLERNQDFVLITGDVLVAKDAVEFLAFTRAQLSSKPRRYFAAKEHRLWELLAGMSVRPTSGSTVADFRYWSAVPFRFGPDRAVKFSVRPREKRRGRRINESFHDALARRLAVQDIVIDFFVQFQTDPNRMPVEDATVRWSERVSKPCRVATITLPRQNVDDPALVREGEASRFSPWNCLPAHRPIGSINRARREIYEVLQAQRSRV